MRRQMPTVLVGVILASLLVSACAPPATVVPPTATAVPPALTPAQALAIPDAKSLVETRCSVCHGLKVLEEVMKSKGAWKSTVERMVVEEGAQLDQVEQELVTKYLGDTYVLECCM